MTALPPVDYAARRARVARELGEGGVLVLAAGAPRPYSRDIPNRFRAHADFLWLCGLDEPQGVLVLRGGATPRLTLFVRPRDPSTETWTGRRPGPEGAIARTGADAAFPVGELAQQLPDLLEGAERLYYEPWAEPALDAAVHAALDGLEAKEGLGRRAPRAIVRPGVILHEARLLKDAAEIARIERAARVTLAGIEAGLAAVRPGATERDVQAAIEGAFLAAGASGPGFGTIVAGGANGCILHYVENDAPLSAGELVLIDAGAEVDGYNGDVSRTVPVDGRFTPAQKAVHDAVDGCRRALIDAVRPGESLPGLRARHARLLAAALVELGVLVGSVDAIVAEGRHKPYTLHAPSHWLGLDVHDVGDAYRAGEPRPFAPGMALTVEPGLYLPPGDEKVPVELRGIAVRLEDDVVVTETGCRVLTGAEEGA